MIEYNCYFEFNGLKSGTSIEALCNDIFADASRWWLTPVNDEDDKFAFIVFIIKDDHISIADYIKRPSTDPWDQIPLMQADSI